MNLVSIFLAVSVSLSGGPAQEWFRSRPEMIPAEKKLSSVSDVSFEDSYLEDVYTDGEEGVVLPSDIENPLLEEPLAQSKDAVPLELLFKNPEGKVKFFEYGEELFDIMEFPDGQALITVNSGIFTMRIYNEDRIITEKTSWKNSISKEEKTILNSVLYSYNYDSEKEKKYLSQVRTEDFQKKNVTLNLYASDGKLTESSQFIKTEDNKELLIRKTVLTYNAERKLIQKLITNYEQKPGEEKSICFLEKKYTYSYREGFDDPDEKYYENSVLRISTVYTNPSDKTVFHYFDGGVGVKVFYADGIKTGEETFFSGGR
ncbi:MAG: hypothetical protein J5780_04285 [Treponema sp.]|nr:hypothetical protein [Treponema sp.]